MFRLVQPTLGTRQEITNDDIRGHIAVYSDDERIGNPVLRKLSEHGVCINGLRLLTRCPKIKYIENELSCLKDKFAVMTQLAKKCPDIEQFGAFTRRTAPMLVQCLSALDGPAQIKTIAYKFGIGEVKDGEREIRCRQITKFSNDIHAAIKMCPKLDKLDFEFKLCMVNSDQCINNTLMSIILPIRRRRSQTRHSPKK